MWAPSPPSRRRPHEHDRAQRNERHPTTSAVGAATVGVGNHPRRGSCHCEDCKNRIDDEEEHNYRLAEEEYHREMDATRR